jgi:putative redox protein
VFQARSRIGDGLMSTVAFASSALGSGLVGTDKAPNPVEYVLAALGACQEITYRLYAAASEFP